MNKFRLTFANLLFTNTVECCVGYLLLADGLDTKAILPVTVNAPEMH